jgi:CelD/BcsL family acetyltransferase involved in cellulose biosynthesis
MSQDPHQIHLEAQGHPTRPAWRDILENNPGTALSKTPEWLDCICACDRFTDASLLFRLEDGQRVLLPRVGVRGLPGVFASPPMHWNLGVNSSGFLAESGSLRPTQTQALIHQLQRRSGLRTRMVVGHDDARQWQPAVPKTVHRSVRSAHVLDLKDGFPAIWSTRFTSKVRSNCRKAERRGVSIESDTTGRLVPDFHTLFRSSVDRWAREGGLPAGLMRLRHNHTHPQSKFSTIAHLLGERCTVWLAWQNERPIAGIVVLTTGEHATYWRGAMDKDRCRASGANELLHQHAIQSACEQSLSSYDFGLSSSENLSRFKSSFGTFQEPVHTYHFERIPTAAAEAAGRKMAKKAIRATASLARGHRR